jgi:hypothetical protein
MAVTFQRTFPILCIFDVEKAKEFYVGFLVSWNERVDKMMQSG